MTPTQSAVLLTAVFPEMHPPTYLYNNLVQFHKRNALPQTLKAPVPEDELVVLFHFLQLRLWNTEPAFGTEDIRVWTEDSGTAMDGPNGVSARYSQLSRLSKAHSDSST